MAYVTDAAKEYLKTHDIEDLKEALINSVSKAQHAFDEAKKIAETIKQLSWEDKIEIDPDLHELLEDFDSAMNSIEHCVHA